MLRTSVKRCFPVFRNAPLPQKAPLFARAMFARGGVTIPADKMADCMPTAQRLHRTKTPDPNQALREAKDSGARIVKQNSGIHRADGKVALGRDSRPSMIIAASLIFIGIPAIGWTVNENYMTPTYMANPILMRQRDVKQEYGKGGGGYGTGPNGMEYTQRAPESNSGAHGYKTRTLKPGQPLIKTELN